jgi:hypothetical protein
MNHALAKKSEAESLAKWARELGQYIQNLRDFTTQDWLLYCSWIGTLFLLFFGVTGFVLLGHGAGVSWPGYVWFIPVGVGLFVSALAIDDIGHRTVYKNQLRQGEGYIHKMIVATAVPSVMALCLGFEHPETFRMPALSLIILSFFYSAIDEAMHWRRYFAEGVDRVEMWSHFVAIFGHVLMISCWWQWYDNGYPGVREALLALNL